MISDLLRALGNHLWQTTAFGLCAGAVALLLRKAPACTRSSIWLAASLKFLVPFSLLLGIGRVLAPFHAPDAALEPAPYYRLDTIGQPFTFTPRAFAKPVRTTLHGASEQTIHLLQVGAVGLWLAGSLAVLSAWLIRWRRIAAIVRRAQPDVVGIEAVALRRVAAAMGIHRPIPLLLSRTTLEPGVFGIRRLAMVWPRHLSEKLSEPQIEAIMAHELTHIARRDNLAAALHMIAEAIFWFHPLIWWLHSRLIEEREHACDEAVLLLGNEPEAYAEGILRTCRFSIESPLACMAGIGGSELKQRIGRIMAEEPARSLPQGRKIVLRVLLTAAVSIPVVFGFVDAPRLGAVLLENTGEKAAFHFDAVTIKPSNNDDPKRIFLMRGNFSAQNFALGKLIAFAYDVKSSSQISGCPDWANNTAFDIEAKEDEATTNALDKLPSEERNRQMKLMVQELLQERFHLKVGHSTKELPVYALVIANGGAKLKTSSGPEQVGLDRAGKPEVRSGIHFNGPGEIDASNIGLDGLASPALSSISETRGRVVINKTGLTGRYDFTLKWTPETNAPPPPDGPADVEPPPASGDSPAPGLFTALEEQLGLKLESQKGLVQILVVDSIDHPTPN
jgi:uncharacterized protein (TIGR03435 family)